MSQLLDYNIIDISAGLAHNAAIGIDFQIQSHSIYLGEGERRAPWPGKPRRLCVTYEGALFR